jgi:hypothetical protein
MILMEPDWNPSTDDQSIGRIWRQGQSKEVFIYRLGYSHTIEEFIFFQQYHKVSLLLSFFSFALRCVLFLSSLFPSFIIVCRVN